MRQVNHFKHILIIKHGAFGDLIQSLGAVQDIRQSYPKATLTLLTSPAYQNLMMHCPQLDHVIADARVPYWQLKSYWQLYQTFKQHAFDCVIDLQNSSRTNWYRQWLLNGCTWIGRSSSAPKPKSGLKGLASLLSSHQMPVHYLLKPELSWLAGDVTTLLDQHGIHRQYCVLIPGASAAHPEKRWPYYPQLSEALSAMGFQVVVVLGPDEEHLQSAFSCVTLIKLDWFQLAGVIHHGSFIIGNDTGPSHLASNLQRPGLALFGASTSAVRSELARGPFKTLQVSSLAHLTVETVLEALKPVLKGTS